MVILVIGSKSQMRDSIPDDKRSQYSVQCYPLFSLLQALGWPTILPRVDLLSLDIEGAELAVLQTLPWHRLDIELVLLEVSARHIDALSPPLLHLESTRILYQF